MSDVPTEVIVQILCRLPVKSLLQFRSVSKPWCALIDSPYFVQLHLNQSKKTNNNRTVILGCLTSLYFVDLDSCERYVKIIPPFNCDDYAPRIVGSCNGLQLCHGGSNGEIYLWNPSTRRYKVMSEMPFHFSPGSIQVYFMDYLGYDPVNDDYKVVRSFQSLGSDSKLVDSTVIVYSLKLDAWQIVQQDFPYYICFQRGDDVNGVGSMSHGVSVGGAIHWVVTRKALDMNYLIAAFDLVKQEFTLVPQPEYSYQHLAMDLEVFRGCLAMVRNCHMVSVEIWVMAEYGVKESWTKLVAVCFLDMTLTPLPCVRPITYSKSGEQMLLELENSSLVWYDVRKNTITKFWDDTQYFSTHVHQESLVWAKHGTFGSDARSQP